MRGAALTSRSACPLDRACSLRDRSHRRPAEAGTPGAIVAIAMGIATSLAVAQTSPTTRPVDHALARLGSVGLTVHDPSSIARAADGEYWLFSTGNGLRPYRSNDLKTWRAGPWPVLATPAWVADEVRLNRGGHFWAPDIIKPNGRCLLYYSEAIAVDEP